MVVYKITNLINSKIYIGQTTRTLKRRWNQHCNKNTGCCAIKNAIQKYGKENFVIESIEVCYSQQELDIKEKYWVNFYNSLSPNGYNLKTGGEHAIYSLEARKKMSEIRKGRFKGKDHPFAISILCNEINKSFESIKQASEYLKIHRPDIIAVLKGRRKHAGGYTFSYLDEELNG